MDFKLTDEQRLLQEGAARFFEKSYDFKCGFERKTWQTFADMGWLAAALPESRGGLGFGPIELALLAEEMGRHLVIEPFVACGVLPALLWLQVEKLGQARAPGGAVSSGDRALAAIATGEMIYAVACSELGARGDVHWVAASAKPLIEGATAANKRWVLNGHKSLVIGAPIADRLLVVVRCAGKPGDAAGLALFDIAANVPGIELDSYQLADGTPAADVQLTNVIVAQDASIGVAGEAGAGVQAAIDAAIVLQCAETVGSTENVLALCSDYLKTRKQFGVAIGSFQALQHRMADMAIEAAQIRASVYRGLQALTAGAAQRRSVDISGVKAQVVKSARFVTQQGIQLHGGYGITEEYRVGHHWRRLLLTDSVFGGQSFHIERYARAIQSTCAVDRC